MKYAILLVLDGESQNKITQIRGYLSQNGVGGEVAEVAPYHITIASLDIDSEDTLLQMTKNFADNQKTFSLSFACAGTFLTSQNVLFFPPIVTSELTEIHEKYNSLLAKDATSFDEYYTANHWVPHCTVASGISDSELTKAFNQLKQSNPLPFKAKITSICVLKCDQKPYSQIALYKFH